MAWKFLSFGLFILLEVVSVSCKEGMEITGVNTQSADLLAFPGAEGFGAWAVGGRGGKVYEVTHLNDSGVGSFRAAVEAQEPRTVLFRVSGTIELESTLMISNPYITIAGQTAPGEGICLKNYGVVIKTHDVIIRYIRFRPGDDKKQELDALSGTDCKNIIIDHCSASWGIDECVSFYRNENLTVQWCLISESLTKSFHSKGPHGYGGIWGGPSASFHHNLFVHHTSRNPRFAPNSYDVGDLNVEDRVIDFRNNVVYNWGFGSAYGGEEGRINMVGNTYKSGPATQDNVRSRILEPYGRRDKQGWNYGSWYLADNLVVGYPKISNDNWNGGVRGNAPIEKIRMVQPFPSALVITQPAKEAYFLVLSHVGANLPKRDKIDTRLIEEVRTGTAVYGETWGGGGKGIIDSQNAVGGWPNLESDSPPVDSDHDGMPDVWERENGLNPKDSTDGNEVWKDSGYTNLEIYLNELVRGQRKDYPFQEVKLDLSEDK